MPNILRAPRRVTVKRSFFAIVGCACLLLFGWAAQGTEVAPGLSADLLRQGPVELDRGWHFHPATPQPPAPAAEAWRPLQTTFDQAGQFPPDWSGLGWFRLAIEIPQELTGSVLALRLQQAGASEVFIDGELVATYGHPAADSAEEKIYDPKGAPLSIVFARPGRHEILLRYSSTAVANSRFAPWLTNDRGAGFRLSIDLPQRAVDEVTSLRLLHMLLNIGGGSLALGFAILHGLIYLFHRRHRGNLWFSLFAFCFAANGLLESALRWTQLSLWQVSVARSLNLLAASGMVTFLVFFLATLRRENLPLSVRWLPAGLLPALVFYQSPALLAYFGLVFGLWILTSGAMALWAGLDAVRHRVEGAAVLLVSALGWVLMVLAQVSKARLSASTETLLFACGLLLIFAGASLFLARRIAHEGRELETLTLELEDRVQERTRELRRSEQAALAASHAKSAFLATMSHELRTPMNAIIGFSELLDTPALPDRERQMVGTLKGSALALLHLIDEVLDLSRIESGRLYLDEKPMAVRPMVQQVIELFSPQAQQKGLALRAELDETVPQSILGDSLRLRQVLINLVGNALKFTDDGSIVVAVSALDGVLRFAVQDTGMGIAESARRQLFDPFFQVDSSSTRRHGGAGLGLAICQRLVDSMGGRLEVASTVGQGSTFSFEIPMRSATLPTSARPSVPLAQGDDGTPVPQATTSPDLSGLRVLLAEDNEVNRIVTLKMLARLGCQGRAVGGGTGVLEALRNEQLDVVLLDLHMPDLDGFEVARCIRASQPDDRGVLEGRGQPYLVAYTASAQHEDRLKAMDVGMDAFLSKPVRMEALQGVLSEAAKVLGRSQGVAKPT